MAKNTDLSKLDWNVTVANCVEASNDALRVVMGSSEFAIALDSTEDSVQTVSKSDSGTATVTNATATGSLLEIVAEGHNKFQIFCKTLTTITGPQVLTLEVSPVDSGDFWVATAVTLTPDATAGVTKMSTVGAAIAKRARITCASQISAGSFTLVLVVQG